jgi:beta-lactamase superfamily II metal-dependent hydrolase
MAEGTSVLFTGDARGDRIVEQLRGAAMLRQGILRVAALKVPHHGSARSCTIDLFRTVIADHYLISGDGSNGNPSPETARRICSARVSQPPTAWS